MLFSLTGKPCRNPALSSQAKDKAKSNRRLCSGWVTDISPHPGEGQWWSKVCRQGQHVMHRGVISRGEGAERQVLLPSALEVWEE